MSQDSAQNFSRLDQDPTIIRAPAGQVMYGGDKVFLAFSKESESTKYIPGVAYWVDAGLDFASGRSMIVGVGKVDSASGYEAMEIQIIGEFTYFGTPGAIEYIGQGGGLTESKPIGNHYVKQMGISISSDSVLLNSRGEDNPTGSSKGYISGGDTGSPVTTAEKLNYSTATTNTHSPSELSQARSIPFCIGYPGHKGYMCGGWTGGAVSVADLLVYDSDIMSAKTSANLANPRVTPSGISEGHAKGYMSGGWSSSGTTETTNTDDITFSTDITAANTTAVMIEAKHAGASLSEGTIKGYQFGGNGSSYKTPQKLTFSTETYSTNSSDDPVDFRYYGSGCNGTPFTGYLCGGQSGVTSTRINHVAKVVYSTDTPSTLSGQTLSESKSRARSITSGLIDGFICGGDTSGSAYTDTTDRIVYSTETISAETSADLSQSRRGPGGLSDSYV